MLYACLGNRITVLLLSSALTLSLTACSKDIRDTNRQSAGVQPSPGQSRTEIKSIAEKVEEEGPKAHGKQDPDYVKANLKPGLTQAQIVSLFGKNYAEVVHDEGGTRMWRYDYADVGYQFQASGDTGQSSNESVLADINGLRRGMVHGQLFIGWDAGTGATGYSEFYYITDQHTKHGLRLFTVYPDGKTTDRQLKLK